MVAIKAMADKVRHYLLKRVFAISGRPKANVRKEMRVPTEAATLMPTSHLRRRRQAKENQHQVEILLEDALLKGQSINLQEEDHLQEKTMLQSADSI